MKKTIVTVFGVILVLIVMGFLVNIVTGGDFVRSIVNAVAEPINGAWRSITGDANAQLINAEAIVSDSGVDDDTSLGGLYDDTGE